VSTVAQVDSDWLGGLATTDSFALTCDSGNHCVRKVDLATGEVTAIGACGTPGFIDATGASARFDYPYDVSIAPGGTFALVAEVNNKAIRKIDLATLAVSTLYTYPSGGEHHQGHVRGISIDPTGQFALATDGSAGGGITKIDITTGTGTIVAGGQYTNYNHNYQKRQDGVGVNAIMSMPCGIEIAPDGTFALFTDKGHCSVHKVDLQTWEVTTVAGQTSTDAYGNTARSCGPQVDGTGEVVRFHYMGVGVAIDATSGYALIPDGVAVRAMDLTTFAVSTVVHDAVESADGNSLAGAATERATGVAFTPSGAGTAIFSESGYVRKMVPS
jgi:hypothetical protein